MELTRRDFCTTLVTSVAALLTGAWRAGSEAARARWMAVLRRGGFPGRLRPMEEAEVRTPAKWHG